MSLRLRIALHSLTACVSICALALPAFAQNELEQSLRSAQLIFRGAVEKIETRNSEPDDVHPSPVPHTFVTYRIDEVLKGSTQRGRITLRFVGGPIDRDQFILPAHSPLFDVGDTDLLLVEGNSTLPCPLVGCANGRFRLIDQMIVNEEGQRLQLGPDRVLRPGPELDLDEVNINQMSKTIRLEKISVPDPDYPQSAATPPEPPPLDPALDPSPERFLAFMREEIVRTHTAEELERARETPVADADSLYPFFLGEPSAPGSARPAELRARDAAAPSMAAEAAAAGTAAVPVRTLASRPSAETRAQTPPAHFGQHVPGLLWGSGIGLTVLLGLRAWRRSRARA